MLKCPHTACRMKTRCRAPVLHVQKVVTRATHAHRFAMTSKTCPARKAHMQEGNSGVWQLVEVV